MIQIKISHSDEELARQANITQFETKPTSDSIQKGKYFISHSFLILSLIFLFFCFMVQIVGNVMVHLIPLHRLSLRRDSIEVNILKR